MAQRGERGGGGRIIYKWMTGEKNAYVLKSLFLGNAQHGEVGDVGRGKWKGSGVKEV